MNWDQVKGNWAQLKGQVKAQWGHLTDDEIDIIDGRKDILIGKVQERYGISKNEAEQEVKEFEARQFVGEPEDAYASKGRMNRQR